MHIIHFGNIFAGMSGGGKGRPVFVKLSNKGRPLKLNEKTELKRGAWRETERGGGEEEGSKSKKGGEA